MLTIIQYPYEFRSVIKAYYYFDKNKDELRVRFGEMIINDGIIEKSINRATVGYPYTGYNVGGICGRTIGRIYDCENYGLIQGRKDVGGIAGQMEPLIIINNANTVGTSINSLDKTIKSTRDDVKDYADSWDYIEPDKEKNKEAKSLEDLDFGTFEHNRPCLVAQTIVSAQAATPFLVNNAALLVYFHRVASHEV